MVRSISEASKRKDRVAHVRFSPAEFNALEAAASAAGMTVSAFVRSLSMEGAGVRPFLGTRIAWCSACSPTACGRSAATSIRLLQSHQHRQSPD
jgi:hypothetical protein